MANYGYQYGLPVGRSVIQGLGGKITPEKLRFFEAWARAEGTKAAYNPFATTKRGYAGETGFNQVGVKNYPDLATGVRATIDTLKLGYYSELVDLLRRDDVTAEQLATAVAASPWGTGTGVLRVLGVKAVDGYEKAQSTAQYGAKKVQLEKQYITTTLDRFRPSEAYVRTLQSMGPAGQPALTVAQGFQPFTLTQEVPAPTPGDIGPTEGRTPPITKMPMKGGGGFIQLPVAWKGTHVTDQLGWGTKTAEDIMGNPGTGLGAPMAGEVIYYHPTGAQGGGSMLVRYKSGQEVWLGHIESGLGPGSKFKAGQQIAVISADHPNPHVHIDRRSVSKKKKK